MKKISSIVAFGIVALASATLCQAQVKYHFIKEIPVGGEARWDYLSIDPDAHRLYVAHATVVSVIDLEKDAPVGEVTNTPGVHGFAIASKLGRGFASNGRENKASIVDLKTLQTISKVDTGENPDAILYVPAHDEVYTFNGRGKSATVFDAKSGKVLATIKLSGKPEFAVFDAKADRVYCNIEDKSELTAIDATKHEVAASWPIAPGEEASGLAFDPEHHRLFLGCGNKMMVMMDSTTGKVVTSVPIGEGVDANAFDPGTQLAFSSNGEGNATIAKLESPTKLTVVQTLPTEKGARTMALDPTTHNIYLAAKSAQNGLKILVYGPEISKR